jgi:hypothetical protein
MCMKIQLLCMLKRKARSQKKMIKMRAKVKGENEEKRKKRGEKKGGGYFFCFCGESSQIRTSDCPSIGHINSQITTIPTLYPPHKVPTI